MLLARVDATTKRGDVLFILLTRGFMYTGIYPHPGGNTHTDFRLVQLELFGDDWCLCRGTAVDDQSAGLPLL